MDVSLEVDTLVLDQKYHFVNVNNDSLQIYEHETPILDLELPKLEGVSRLDIDETSSNFYIYFGKRLDNGEYSLQLNDKYEDIYDLRAFTNNRSCSGFRDELLSFPIIYLFIEGTTPLSYVDQIFNELIMSNMLKVGFINNINLIQNETELYYDFEMLIKKITEPSV
ncbi:hypothetical protein ES692_08265 [Psychroserpens burtonensis]|uniref:Uncharacterized protein n=1 Tax=Psychroserpens burtonensis TaxID=49278 RepID=A0A5C7BGQ4_9FLAO|nr:hypothetical protein [Psychroserpens burtonensis]TXE17881.1 hypothetical protein ES692_08265 [Psychroserpens burtonensis]